MKVLLTERTVEIVLDEDDIRHLVDGNDVAGIPSTKFLNPTLSLAYTTSQVGIFTVRAQTKSTTFEVVQQVPGTYYPLPFWGKNCDSQEDARGEKRGWSRKGI